MKILTPIAVGDAIGKAYVNDIPVGDKLVVNLIKPRGAYSFLRPIDYTPYTRFANVVVRTIMDYYIKNSKLFVYDVVKLELKSNYMKSGNLLPVTVDNYLAMFNNYVLTEDITKPFKISAVYDDFIPRETFLVTLSSMLLFSAPSENEKNELFRNFDQFMDIPSDLLLYQNVLNYFFSRMEEPSFEITDWFNSFLVGLESVSNNNKSGYTLKKVLECIKEMHNTCISLEMFLTEFIYQNRFNFHVDLHSGIIMMTFLFANLYSRRSFPTKYKNVNRFDEFVKLDEILNA